MRILIDGQTLSTPELNRGIGIYFKNVLNNMVKQNFAHEWFLLVSSVEVVSNLDEWVAKRVSIIVDEVVTPCSDFSRNEAYTVGVEKIVQEQDIDIFWIPNPLMVNVLFLMRYLSCKVFATVYDLIPLVMPPKEWADVVSREYKRRLAFVSQTAMHLICISESTKQDVEKYLHKKENVTVTFLAADCRTFYHKKTVANLDGDEPFIVFTGGFDYRKNIDGAIKAFAKCINKYSQDKCMREIKLYIVCKCDAYQSELFDEKLNHYGLKDRVVLTGFVSDERLSELYSNALVFFFPSLYEGFGLPIVEAMLGGAYIVSADNSSLPEVCGGHATLCNADDIEDMADKLYLGICNSSEESMEQKQARQEYALKFNWEDTALNTLCGFEKSFHRDHFISKTKLAIVTPWPEQKTGIAYYVYELTKYLIHYFEIDVFVDNSQGHGFNMKDIDGVNVYPIKKLEDKHGEYRNILYQFGNNSAFHTGVYEMFCKYPDIAEIHDYILTSFFYHSFMLGHKSSIYKAAFEWGYGKDGVECYKKIKQGASHPNESLYPMCHSIANQAKKTIFHNHWSKEQFDTRKKDIFVIPLACFDSKKNSSKSNEEIRQRLISKLHKEDDELLIGCFGFVNLNKRPERIIQSVKNLLDDGMKVKLAFWGENNWSELNDFIQRNGLSEKVFVMGYLDKEEYEVGLSMTDIVINLRFPTMGESSATLCETFKSGKPVIVSNINQYTEFPDEVCWKVDMNSNDVKVLTEMLRYLVDNPSVRDALGENAKNYADFVLSPEKIAKMYLNTIVLSK